ncbi:tRNA modification GTPase MnmE [[Eubacterium] infirmum]|nr:tRNA modification GTPase MnmE [[Eubacterium] infirmum]
MESTIAAIATSPGESGIGIIRISGEESLNILNKIFYPASKNLAPKDNHRQLIYGHIKDEFGHIIDEVLAVYFPAPKTYTAEDVVEIDCHGGIVPLSNTLSLVLRCGANLAEPGEFTKRAFLNGRLDLTQAEAVIDVINSKTNSSFDVAMEQLRGRFSKEINEIRKEITDVLVDIAVNIDYPDEDIELILYDKLEKELRSIKKKVDYLIDSSDTGRILREGLNVAIIGRPNVGKSSLMNAMLRESRAIVTEIPGTTRDTIEELINVRGIPVNLIDTAGIRSTDDVIEQIGIDKSKKSLESADLVIFMIDLTSEISTEDYDILNQVDKSKLLILFNKADKTARISEADIASFAREVHYMITSVNDSKSVDEIENAIFEKAGGNLLLGKESETDKLAGSQKSNIVTNARHKNMLERAATSLGEAINAASGGMPLEFLEIDIRNAYEELGFITGDSVQDDVIDEVFSRFCLGK